MTREPIPDAFEMPVTSAGIGVDPNGMLRHLLTRFEVSDVEAFGVGWQIFITEGDRRGSIVVSQAPHEGDEWVHASIWFDGSMPSYEDLACLHRAVFGRRRWAYQVFAPESEHIDIKDVLHLWGRVDGKPALPNFGRYGTI